MSTPSEPSPVNGLAPPIEDDKAVEGVNGVQSDSDLSDVQGADLELPSPTPSPESPNVPELTLNDNQDLESIHESHSSDNEGSDDADFDMVESPASPQADAARDERSASNDSRPATKRKINAGLEYEIMKDPELYGLRRSVCHLAFSVHRSMLTTKA